MALQVEYKITQGAECDKIIFEDTTPVFDAVTALGGYGAPNVTRANITATQFIFTLPDSTIVTLNQLAINKNCLPDPAGSVKDIFPSDMGLTALLDECHEMEYEVYVGDIASGSIVLDKKYIVLDPTGTASTVTYDGNTFKEGDTFIGTAVTTYTEGNALMEVSALESSVTNKFIVWCNVRNLIKSLALTTVKEKCQKECDWVDELFRLNMELDYTLLAFSNGMNDCACTSIKELSKEAVEFFNKCCC